MRSAMVEILLINLAGMEAGSSTLGGVACSDIGAGFGWTMAGIERVASVERSELSGTNWTMGA
ncbi:hypothetical protein RBB77_11765 [Tunturibacter psychrotolerans]|uniref:Uncharacterized protein n=1 Tax=Tunturiibacter psychrotolerans TaxID=3069686 RepID=A0AAU7ZIZ6_9BACT